MNSKDHTLELASFLANLTYEHLSPGVVQQAKKSILNALGCGIGYAGAPPAHKALRVVQSEQPCSEATILGRKERASVQNASLVNGIALTTADYDDTHLKTVLHPSGTSLAALISFAEVNHLSGREFILAFVCGLETQCAVANAISPTHYENGWHITGTTGSFAAAAAMAKALKLKPAQFAAAFGHAASMGGGLRAMFGTDTKTLHMGRSAQNGLLAASLASHGFGSCDRAIEAWARLVSSTVKEESLSALADAGAFEILSNTFKPYPCGIVIHPIIDAALEAHDFFQRDSVSGKSENLIVAEELEGIDVIVNPLCVRLCSVRHPKSAIETIFSLYHGCAVALLYGRATPTEFSDAGCQDLLARSARDKIRVETDETMPTDAAHVTVRFSFREERLFRVEHATGSLARPMTSEQLEAKFLDLARGVLGQERAVEIVEKCRSLEKVEDMHEFVRMLAPV